MALLKGHFSKDKKSKSSDEKKSRSSKSRSETSSSKHDRDPKKLYSKSDPSKVRYDEAPKYHPTGRYYSISDSDSERTLPAPPPPYTKEGERLSEKQAAMARRQLAQRDIDAPSHPSHSSKSSSSKSKSKSKSSSKDEKSADAKDGKGKKKLGRWFDLSSLATPIAVYNLPADFNGDDPNVYWDEEAKVWRYWYYTWCPIF